MVCVGGDVGDEFLGGEREEAGEGEGGVGGGGEAGEEEVVGCYCVGDLGDKEYLLGGGSLVG